MKKIITSIIALFFVSNLFFPKIALADSTSCSVTFPSGSQVRPGNTIWIIAKPLECGCWYSHRWHHLYLFGPGGEEIIGCSKNRIIKEKEEIDLLCDGGLLCKPSDNSEWRFGIQAPYSTGTYKIEIHSDRCVIVKASRELLCSGNFTVSDDAPPQQSPPGEPEKIPYETEICRGNEKCIDCQVIRNGSWTALGCIPQDPTALVAWVLARAMGIGGGVAFLLTILGAFQVITSSGDPDKVKAGKDMITAAISGLLLIIFSLFLLQFIGVKILNIPGFGQ